MHSGIYEGWVRHRRYRPVRHTFRYPLFMMYLDLSELAEVCALHPLWSVERWNLACFRRRDYLGDPSVPLEQAVRDVVEADLGRRPEGGVRVLTHLRYFGYCFNPVSFYYCYDGKPERLSAIVASVTNTPWGQRRNYVLDARQAAPGGWRTYRLPKQMHVSPFMPMDIEYDWRLRAVGERASVHMVNRRGGEKVFDATLRLQRREISRASLGRALARYPLMTFKVVWAIHFQAFRLWRKGATFYAHPDKLAAAETGP